jgi:8-oxo-dGTP pyrophosphatase MutT (NUDIX family)
MTNRQRATAIIIRDWKILLIRRVKYGKEYFILPGGGVEPGETAEAAFLRETKEELCIDVVSWKKLFTIENVYMPAIATKHPILQTYHCFSVDEYKGIPEIGGEEKASITPQNHYFIEWVPVAQLASKPEIYPYEVAQKLAAEYS